MSVSAIRSINPQSPSSGASTLSTSSAAITAKPLQQHDLSTHQKTIKIANQLVSDAMQPLEAASKQFIASVNENTAAVNKDTARIREQIEVTSQHIATMKKDAEARRELAFHSSIASSGSGEPPAACPVSGTSVERQGGIQASESAPLPAPAAAPSCFARFCIYVKHSIAAFFDWVGSLFCGSKRVTLERVETEGAKLNVLWKETYQIENRINTRYPEIENPTENDAYRYLADSIEVAKIMYKGQFFLDQVKECEEALKNGEINSDKILTERQLRSIVRQLKEWIYDIASLLDKKVQEKKCTDAMKESVAAYFLGKTSVINDKGEKQSLFEAGLNATFPDAISQLIDQLKNKIREKRVERINQELPELRKLLNDRYSQITLKDLEGNSGESRAICLLADCIDRLRFISLLERHEGDLSEEVIDALKKRLDPTVTPILNQATQKMRETICQTIILHSRENYVNGMITTSLKNDSEASSIEARLSEVIRTVKQSQEAPSSASKSTLGETHRPDLS